MRRAAFLAVVLIALVLRPAAAKPAASPCMSRIGQHVVLYSVSDDPQVFVFDTKIRLRDYHAASVDEMQEIAKHAWLVAPGTRAMIVTCEPGFVQSPYFSRPDDAIGVLLLTGSHRGHTGWVLGSDVRGVYHDIHR